MRRQHPRPWAVLEDAGAVAERDRYRGRKGYFVPDQFGNPDNARCHERTTGVELVRQLHRAGVHSLGAFVAGVGTGGTLMGVGRALRTAMPQVRVVAVEPAESAVMGGGPPGDHGIQGIGDGFVPALVEMKDLDEVVAVSTAEAHAEAERIRIEHGFCVGPSSGANLLAARRLKARGVSVATLWPDCSDRYVSVGLLPPAAPDVRCPLQTTCVKRSASRLAVAR